MLHRQLLDNPIIRKPKYCHLWITLLLKAAHTGTSFIWNNKRQYLQPGQLLTSRDKLSEATGIKPSTVENILKYLKSEQQIRQQTYRKFRIITIKNWEKYQYPKKNEQQSDNRLTTDGQQNDTYNNDNNANNVKKYSQTSDEVRLSTLLFSEIRRRKPDFREPHIHSWAKHIDRMIRLDSRTPERIEAVIRWCQRDSFWKNNIPSARTLREKFDRLELIMQGDSNGTGKTGSCNRTEQPFIR